MSEMNISFDEDGNLTHTGDSRVIYPVYVEFIRNGKVAGTISATFDFSNVPDDLHQLGINIISRHTIRVGLPSEEDLERSREWSERREARKALPWWKRWFYHDIFDPL